MIPKTKQLFISYRSSDAAQVDKIARDLALLRHADGTPRYTTWQDKHNLPPASPHWWDAIVDALDASDIFVFHLSRASLQSEVCRAELDYAHKRNRPIIPVVLDGAFLLDPQSGKYNIDYWDQVPDWLAERQFLFYTGAEFYGKFQEAVALFERNWPRDVYAQRPLNPDDKSAHATNHARYDAACDYAERLAFTEAEKHFDALVRRNDPDYAGAAAEWLELVRLYAELIEIDQRRSARFIFKNKWTAYTALFPKEFLDGIFDPKGFASAQPLPVPVQPTVPTPKRSADLLPAPFAWVEIPGKGYSIAKYPVTNAQFRLFVEAGGYTEPRWWTDAGWEACAEGWHYDGGWKPSGKPWTQPRYWGDSKWNGPQHPVVGVSWFEAVAFCQWVSAATGETIRLPTEDEWQYAAQGDDGRVYPWGNDWDCKRCNNSVKPCNSSGTTPVQQYAGKGDSPFGVVDMAGNVWEWCMTDYDNRTNDLNGEATRRVLRGGSWNGDNTGNFRWGGRSWVHPRSGGNGYGFRLALLFDSGF